MMVHNQLQITRQVLRSYTKSVGRHKLYSSIYIVEYFFSFRLELIPRRRGVTHSDPLPPHVSSPGVIWFQAERFQVLLNHVHPSLLLPSSAAKSLYSQLHCSSNVGIS